MFEPADAGGEGRRAVEGVVHGALGARVARIASSGYVMLPLGANDQTAELAGWAEFGLDVEDAAKSLEA